MIELIKLYIKPVVFRKKISDQYPSSWVLDDKSSNFDPVLLIREVSDNSIAKFAGLKTGDRILSIDNLNFSKEDAVNYLHSIPANVNVTIKISRQAPSLSTSIVEASSPPRDYKQNLSFEVALNIASDEKLGLDIIQKEHAGQSCLFIKNVINGTASAKNGKIQANDRIIAINGLALFSLALRKWLKLWKI